MSVQQQSGSVGGQGAMTPVVVITILAIIANFAITTASAYGHNIFFPINILGGFSFNVAPLLPAATALILAFGLWQYSHIGQGRAWIAALCLFVAPILFVQIWNAFTGWLLNLLPDSVVTNSQNFYGIFFIQRAVSAAGVLVVLTVAAAGFRAWTVWLWVLIIWAGGDTLLFGLYRDQVITREIYMWLYPVERVIGFIVLACYYQRPARSEARPKPSIA
jgi:hypothetical protein